MTPRELTTRQLKRTLRHLQRELHNIKGFDREDTMSLRRDAKEEINGIKRELQRRELEDEDTVE